MAVYKAKARLIFGILIAVIGVLFIILMQNSSAEVLQIPDEVMDSCVKMDNPEVVDASLEGQYVWAQGDVKTPGMLRDNEFGVEMKALYLSRECYFFQVAEYVFEWVDDDQEHRAEYSYKNRWESAQVDSHLFHESEKQDANSVICEVESKEFYATEASLGAYSLPPSMLASIVDKTPADISFSPADVEAFASRYNIDLALIHQSPGELYIGNDPNAPAIGDVKIVFTYFGEGPASVLGVVEGDGFADGDVALIRAGRVALEDMLIVKQPENIVTTLETTFVGLLILILGLFLLITFCAKNPEARVPVLSCFYVKQWKPVYSALALTLCLGLIIVGIGRVGGNPLLGACLMALGAAALYFYRKKN